MKRILLLCCLIWVAGVSLYAQPANDNCADAIAVALDEEVTFSTDDATTDGPKHADCLGVNDSISLDIWYTFTAPEDAILRWSNCGTANFDSRIAIYNITDACLATDDNLVACNDDGPAACSADFFTSEVLFPVTAGEDYVLRMGGFADENGEASGSGTVVLSVVEGVPSNGFCGGAFVVELGTGQEFSTLNALTDGPDHEGSPCFGFGSITAVSDIWFTYTPDFTGFVEWSTCGMADFDTRLAIYSPGSACPPMSDDLYSCNDDGAGCSNFSSTVTFSVAAGETYLLRLGGFNGSGTGMFDLSMVTPPDPPANDDCANAIPTDLITADEADTFEFLTTGTTVSGTFISEDYEFPICLTNQNGGEFADVWYSFESLGNTEIDIQLFPFDEVEPPATNFYLDIFASCDMMVDTMVILNSCVSVDADNAFGEATLTGLPEGENVTYFVRVTTRLTSDIPGVFAFQLIGEIVSDVENVQLADNLQVYPNPANEQATVRFNLQESTTLNVRVNDMLGRQVHQQQLGTLASGTQQFGLDVSTWSAGIYFLELSTDKGRQSLKLVVD